MIINEIYIEAFGKIKSERFVFSDGLSSILLPNGEGKTTLTVFIKAMLYGLDDTRRSVSENERKRYLPWSGECASGYMLFTHEGREYRIERRFSKKASEDTLVIYDTKRGSTTDVFTDVPGEALFGIDKAGFERTIFLSERLPSGAIENDSITGKLEGLVGVEYDIGEYEPAISLLDEERKRYRKRGGGGEISEKKSERAALAARLEVCLGKRAEYRGNLERIAGKKEQLTLFQREKELLEKRRGEESDEAKKRGYINQYKLMGESLGAMEDEELRLKNKLGGNPPTLIEAIEKKDKLHMARADASSLARYGEGDSEIFKSMPDREHFNELQEEVEEAKVNTRLLPLILLIVFGAISEAAALLVRQLEFAGNNIVSILFMLLGVVFFGAAFITVVIRSKSLKLRAEKIIKVFDYIEECYGRSFDEDTYDDLCEKFESDIEKAEEQRQSLSTNSALYNQRLASIREYEQFFARLGGDINEVINDISSLESLRHSIRASRAALDEFAKKHNIEAIKATVKESSADNSINKEISESYNKIIECEREIAALMHSNERLLSEIEEADTISEKIEELDEAILYAEERLEVITATIQLLGEAKNSMTEKYLDGTKRAFKKYLNFFGEEGDFSIDTSFEIKKVEASGTKEREAYSEGTRDLWSICMRLALIDSLYGDATPPLIIDDAFSGLDDMRLYNMKSLLKKLSESRQIIYFTCQSARNIN